MNSSFILFALFVVYILIPKIDIASIGGGAIRVNDILIVLCAALSLFSRNFKFQISKSLAAYYVFLLSQLLSFILNLDVLEFSGILFIARLFEYTIWFYVAQSLSMTRLNINFSKVCSILVIILSVWAILEWFQVVPKSGKFVNVTDRVSVNTSGPYEFAALIAMLVYLSKTPQKYIGVLSLFLTQSRITITAYFVSLLWGYRKNSGLLLSLFIVLLMTTLLAVNMNLEVLDVFSESRFALLISDSSTLDLALAFISTAPVVHTPHEYFEISHVGSGVTFGLINDVSLEMRLLRWSIVLSTVSADYISLAVGMGPSFWGVALDGNYIRIIGEQGIIGAFTFLFFLNTLLSDYKQSLIRSFLVVLCITAVFIDIFVADKVMTVFWFVQGILFTQNRSAFERKANDKGVFLCQK
ncbi:hypothetical protein [Ketobacter sp.]|uniref:hypothetical protein n=1 Tax=Ketobacter sp. TaxID=2083498 RepID=UPI000F191382|nr:hypothetical protein [Ketobacter sp.]RLT92289.1 MAG: hypothetical protein D9N14_22530 [Ketobacter sp.]